MYFGNHTQVFRYTHVNHTYVLNTTVPYSKHPILLASILTNHMESEIKSSLLWSNRINREY